MIATETSRHGSAGFAIGTFALLISGILTPLSTPLAQSTIYVDVDHPNANDGGDGISTEPFATVTVAMISATSGDTILIRSGNYDADPMTDSAAENFPIIIPRGVTLRGVNDQGEAPTTSERPVIGGMSAGLATHLFEVRATTIEDEEISISGMRFVGEDEPGLDSPIAL